MKKDTVLVVISVFLLFLLCVLVRVPEVYSEGFSAPESALTFLEDVVQLDMTKYNVILSGHMVRKRPKLGGVTQEDVLHTLESNGSKLRWDCSFRNKTFGYCLLDVREGSPIYTQPSASILNMTKGLLQRYQTFMGEPDSEGIRDFEGMGNTLDMVDEIRDMTVTLGNVKLEVKPTAFYWTYLVNDLEFSLITIKFGGGNFYSLSDIWNIYRVGGTDINVSGEEVIDIALNHVENFSWTVGDVEVTDFNVVKETAELHTTRSKEPLTIYPYYRVELYLDNVYPGYVSRISLAVWADTGEIASCIPLGAGGGSLEASSNEPISTSTTEPVPELSESDASSSSPSPASLSQGQVEGVAQALDVTVTTLVAAAIIVLVVAVTVKKRREHTFSLAGV